jgi:plastocyanin
LACLGSTATAATLTADVNDRDGIPVTEVVVYATPRSEAPARRLSEQPPIMDQQGEQFTPHILVVQTATAVSFPNHDTVSHHVYSFSQPKAFELPLYKGLAHPPVLFDQPGIIDVGCNIHDRMEAHIVVVDTPYFGMTSPDGRASLVDLPPGDYSVQIYTPRLRSSALPPAADIEVGDEAETVLQFQFGSRLGPPHRLESESLKWSHY